MIYLGLDASTTKTGYAIFDDDKLIEYGVISSDKKDWRKRILVIAHELCKLIRNSKIEFIVVEDVPIIGGRVTSAKILGVVQGMVLTIASAMKVPIEFIPVTTWRSLMGLFDGTRKGVSREEMKRKSIELANKLFGLQLNWYSPSSTKNDDDISDAILIAYSYIKGKIKGF